MSTPASDLPREDYRAIRDILRGYRANGIERPLLPSDVDIDGDGTADCYGLDENDELIYVKSALEETVYVSDGDDVGQGGRVMADFVYRDGAKLTLWMLYVILLLDNDLFKTFGVHVIVSDGLRTYADQERIFHARYVTAGGINGRRVYDTRWWNGQVWYRISSAGTVAVPGSSNHEIQGDRAAVDIRDTGNDAGITVASSARGRWIREWCRRWGLLIASGDGFGEGWHFDVPGIYRTPPPSGGGGSTTKPTQPAPPTPEEEEDDMPKNSGITWPSPHGAAASKQTWNCLVFNTGSGFETLITNGKGGGKFGGAALTRRAKTFDTTDFLETTEGDAKNILAALAAVRQGK